MDIEVLCFVFVFLSCMTEYEYLSETRNMNHCLEIDWLTCKTHRNSNSHYIEEISFFGLQIISKRTWLLLIWFDVVSFAHTVVYRIYLHSMHVFIAKRGLYTRNSIYIWTFLAQPAFLFFFFCSPRAHVRLISKKNFSLPEMSVSVDYKPEVRHSYVVPDAIKIAFSTVYAMFSVHVIHCYIWHGIPNIMLSTGWKIQGNLFLRGAHAMRSVHTIMCSAMWALLSLFHFFRSALITAI